MTAKGSNPKHVIVLSYEWPGDRGGHHIGCKSCLLVYGTVFSKIHYLCITDHPFDDEDEWRDSNIEWTYIPTVTEPKWLRFVRSLGHTLPAICMRYWRVADVLFERIGEIAAACESDNHATCVILEDIPLACFLPIIRKRFPKLRVALNSHNFFTKAYEGLDSQGAFFERLAWKKEVRKIKRFEESMCRSADRFWALSDQEATEYERILSVRPDGVISRSLDAERFSGIERGDPQTVVHVGEVDHRKKKGMLEFIQRAWPSIRERVPNARLVLAGRNTERFGDPRLGIAGLGFVDDDRDVLGLGLIFLNPQSIGAGIQLKSIVAMLAGKALISTRMGIEGVDGKDGGHFFVADGPQEMIERIVALMHSPELAERASRDARTLAARVYSHEHVGLEARPLVEEFANLEAPLP